MRWLVLLAVLGGLFWSANWSYHQMDHAILITDYWQAQEAIPNWGLVNFKGDNPDVYAFTSSSGFWAIFKGLWPVWTLFLLSFLVLIPLSIYIFTGLNNSQIIAAREAQKEAEKRAKKAILDAQEHKMKTESKANERVCSAYQEQLSRVKKELETEWDSYHRQKNQLLEQESAIQQREEDAQQMEDLARKKVDRVIEQYNQEKARFEAEMAKLTKARDNAQAGYQRLKRKKVD